MRLPIYFYKGDPHKFAVVFIHGLGMDSSIWISPSETRILGGAFPLSTLTRNEPQTIKFYQKPTVLPEKFTIGDTFPLTTSFNDLKEKGYSVITWSQKKLLGSVYNAIEELKYVVNFSNLFTRKGIVLIGHSRGGLIARKFIEKSNGIKALITIATPHKGSTMAKWVEYISNLPDLLKPIFKILPKEKILTKISDFLKSEAVKELLPNSSFICSLKKIENVRYFCLAGENPNLLNIYQWKLKKENDLFILTPEKVFSFPKSFISLLPEKLIPKEWINGDGLVSVESSLIDEKFCRIFYVNHAEIIINSEVRSYILNIVESLQNEN
ncbi:hypothetical protein QI155_09685 [Thermodesulfovibrio sp. 1176]|uniref:esterase/lipase family protein n=1 Tax=Thermodesulfovibrio sp. 1176 TaxID=3043424 RepID=UPI002482BAD1|nr:hypothetical protein [Thermodesulfovibrio sp. 1176]MDI1472801.1 hypothetical protein [Thermodesulfovibrio sp. 1176]